MSDDTQQSGIRAGSIYIEYITRKALYYVPRGNDNNSVDDLANRILAQWLKDNHPKIIDHLKAQAEADNKFKDEYMMR